MKKFKDQANQIGHYFNIVNKGLDGMEFTAMGFACVEGNFVINNYQYCYGQTFTTSNSKYGQNTMSVKEFQALVNSYTKNLEDSLKKAKKDLSALLATKDKNSEKIKLLKNEIEELNKKIVSAQSDQANLQTQKADHDKNHDFLQNEYNNLLSASILVTEDLESARNAQAKGLEKFQQTQVNFSNAQLVNKEVQDNLSELINIAESKKQAVNTANENLDKSKANYSAILEKYSNQIADLNKKAEKSKNEYINYVENVLTPSSEAVELAKAALVAAENELDNALYQNEQAKQECEAAFKAAQDSITVLEENNISSGDAYDFIQVNKAYNEAKEALNTAQSNYDRVYEAFSEKEALLTNLIEKFNEANQRLEEFNPAYNSIKENKNLGLNYESESNEAHIRLGYTIQKYFEDYKKFDDESETKLLESGDIVQSYFDRYYSAKEKEDEAWLKLQNLYVELQNFIANNQKPNEGNPTNPNNPEEPSKPIIPGNPENSDKPSNPDKSETLNKPSSPNTNKPNTPSNNNVDNISVENTGINKTETTNSLNLPKSNGTVRAALNTAAATNQSLYSISLVGSMTILAYMFGKKKEDEE